MTAAELRRDLYGLIALESLQLVVGIGALVAIAVHDVVVTADRGVAAWIALGALLALAYLALSFRLRLAQDLIRRELQALEQALDRTDDAATSGHPYRSITYARK